MVRTDPEVRRRTTHLSQPGPHHVLRGDLTRVGMPGVVFTPQSGQELPAVAFGHGWLQPTSRYEELLRHLASWGIVAVAPATQHGLRVSHRQFAAELRGALDLCLAVRLGDGAISIDPGRLGLAGHGIGGGAAVLAAAADDRCRAVVTLALAETMPSAVAAARDCTMPGLHLAGGKDLVAPPAGHADQVGKAWAGPVQVRVLPKAGHLGYIHGQHWTDLIIDSKPQYAIRRLSRALLTEFLLTHLASHSAGSAG